MELQFEEMINKITEFIEREAQTKTIIGDAFKLGAFDCVPVVKMAVGFGSGGGEGGDNKTGHGEGGGAGGGIRLEPIGFLVSKDDSISFLHAGQSKGLAAAFEKVPDIVEKFMEMKNAETATAN